MQPRLLLLPISSHGLTIATVIQPLQKIQNFAARLVLLAPLHHHSTPLLEKLHWLPISEHIEYKVACMCFSVVSGSGPAYLSELLHVYTPSRTLCSSSDAHMLEIQQYKRKAHGFHTFSCFGPPHLEFTATRPAQPCHLLEPNWKPSSSHSISILISVPSFCYSHCMRVCMCL